MSKKSTNSTITKDKLEMLASENYKNELFNNVPSRSISQKSTDFIITKDNLEILTNGNYKNEPLNNMLLKVIPIMITRLPEYQHNTKDSPPSQNFIDQNLENPNQLAKMKPKKNTLCENIEHVLKFLDHTKSNKQDETEKEEIQNTKQQYIDAISQIPGVGLYLLKYGVETQDINLIKLALSQDKDISGANKLRANNHTINNLDQIIQTPKSEKNIRNEIKNIYAFDNEDKIFIAQMRNHHETGHFRVMNEKLNKLFEEENINYVIRNPTAGIFDTFMEQLNYIKENHPNVFEKFIQEKENCYHYQQLKKIDNIVKFFGKEETLEKCREQQTDFTKNLIEVNNRKKQHEDDMNAMHGKFEAKQQKILKEAEEIKQKFNKHKGIPQTRLNLEELRKRQKRGRNNNFFYKVLCFFALDGIADKVIDKIIKPIKEKINNRNKGYKYVQTIGDDETRHIKNQEAKKEAKKTTETKSKENYNVIEKGNTKEPYSPDTTPNIQKSQKSSKIR